MRSLWCCRSAIVAAISPATITILTGTTWFPTTLAHAFMPSLRLSFYIGALLSVIAAVLSAMGGTRFIREIQVKPKETISVPPGPVDTPNWDIIE